MKTTNRRLWVAGVVVVAALGFLVVRGLGNATLYFRTADEAVAQRAHLGDRRFRIEGTVVPGTVQQQANDVAFAIQHNGVAVPVRHAGDPPELFKPEIPVVLEGRFRGETFSSDRISCALASASDCAVRAAASWLLRSASCCPGTVMLLPPASRPDWAR